MCRVHLKLLLILEMISVASVVFLIYCLSLVNHFSAHFFNCFGLSSRRIYRLTECAWLELVFVSQFCSGQQYSKIFIEDQYNATFNVFSVILTLNKYTFPLMSLGPH